MTPSDSRRSRRDVLKLAAATGLAGATLAGCSRAPNTGGSGSDDGGKTGSGGGSNDKSGSKTFTIYWNAGHVYKAYQKVINQFERDHGVTVNWQKYQWPDLQTKLQTDITAGTVPDLVEQPGGDNAIALALTGDLLALDSYIAADGEKMGFPSDWQSASVRPWQTGGKTYGVQIHLTCSQLYYNKTMLSDAGLKPPSTWDDLLAVAPKLTHDNVYALSLNQDYSYSSPWFLQAGAQLYDPSTKKVLIPRDKALEALQFQHDLIYKYKYSPAPTASSDYSGPQKLLSAKRAAMIITGPWDILPIKQAGGVDLGLALPLKKEERKTILAGSGVVIPAKAANPDLAWDLIKRMTALKVELAVTKEATQTMPRKSWGKQPAVRNDPIISAVAEALAYGVDWAQDLAPTGKLPQINDAFETFYQSVVISNTPPKQAMKTFTGDAAKILG